MIMKNYDLIIKFRRILTVIVTILFLVYAFLSITFLIIPQKEFVLCFILLLILIYRVSYLKIQEYLSIEGKYLELYNYLKSKKHARKSDVYFFASILGDWEYVEQNKGLNNSYYFQILDLENMMLNQEFELAKEQIKKIRTQNSKTSDNKVISAFENIIEHKYEEALKQLVINDIKDKNVKKVMKAYWIWWINNELDRDSESCINIVYKYGKGLIYYKLMEKRGAFNNIEEPHEDVNVINNRKKDIPSILLFLSIIILFIIGMIPVKSENTIDLYSKLYKTDPDSIVCVSEEEKEGLKYDILIDYDKNRVFYGLYKKQDGKYKQYIRFYREYKSYNVLTFGGELIGVSSFYNRKPMRGFKKQFLFCSTEEADSHYMNICIESYKASKINNVGKNNELELWVLDK